MLLYFRQKRFRQTTIYSQSSKPIQSTETKYLTIKKREHNIVWIGRTKPAFYDVTLHSTTPTTPNRDDTIDRPPKQTKSGRNSVTFPKHFKTYIYYWDWR